MWLLGVLMLVDVAFVVMHGLHVQAEYLHADSIFAHPYFSIENDKGYSERYEWAKTVLCIIALGLCFGRTRQPIYGALASVYTWILLDNALRFHERGGLALAGLFSFADSLFPQGARSFGELALFATAGLALFTLSLWSYLHSSTEHRAVGVRFLILIGALACFAVGVDLLHATLSNSQRYNVMLGFVEDGGELVVLSVSCAFAWLVAGKFVFAELAMIEPARTVVTRPPAE